MATRADVRRIALKLPGVEEAHLGVIAARVANLGQRDMMLAAEPAKFFTEPHYAGFPAVLVRLEAVTVSDLRMLIEEAWRCLAPETSTVPAKRSRSPRTP